MRSAPGPTLEGRGRGRGGGARAGNGRGFPAVEGGTRVFYRFYRAPRGRVDTPRPGDGKPQTVVRRSVGTE